MDGSRFDDFAKALHTSPSRRRFLAGVAGAAGAVLAGRATLDDAAAQTFEAQAFDITCQNTGTRLYCFNSEPVTQCGSDCRCAKLRQNATRVCIAQPAGGCASLRSCTGNGQCRRGEVCASLRNCCSPAGKCVRRCPA